MILPPYLAPGDKVGIISTSNFTEQAYIDQLCRILREWQLEPVLGRTIGARAGSFAGPDQLRRDDLQEMLDSLEVKAIFETMGGYGILRIIDQVDFTRFKYQPKWVVGYSDTTFLHSHLQGSLTTASIQATMAADLEAGYFPESWESLRQALFGQKIIYRLPPHPLNRPGKSEAIVVGGTLSLVCNAKGTFSEVSTNGNILFIEEVGEKHFRVDSYITSLKKAGKFKYLKGLVVGRLTDIQEDDPPFGQTAEEIIREAVEEYEFPVCFNFPAGHEGKHLALVFGAPVQLEVSSGGVTLDFKHC